MTNIMKRPLYEVFRFAQQPKSHYLSNGVDHRIQFLKAFRQ